jgi:amino acid permease
MQKIMCASCGFSFTEADKHWDVAVASRQCPKCSHVIEGLPPPIPSTPRKAVPQDTALFLHISVARLILMSIVSFSLYEAYWVYRNWRYVKERDNLTIRPFWRGVFGIFYCHSLLRRIHEDEKARSVQMPSFSPSSLATGWVVLLIIANALSRAPNTAATVVAAFVPSFLCLVPVQNYVNSVTERGGPGAPYYHWSSGHVVCLVIGIIIWALLLIGLGAE